jgi:hypothetical protein
MGSHPICSRFLAFSFCKLQGAASNYSKIQLILNLKAGVSSLLRLGHPETRGLPLLIRRYVKHFGDFFHAALNLKAGRVACSNASTCSPGAWPGAAAAAW